MVGEDASQAQKIQATTSQLVTMEVQQAQTAAQQQFIPKMGQAVSNALRQLPQLKQDVQRFFLQPLQAKNLCGFVVLGSEGSRAAFNSSIGDRLTPQQKDQLYAALNKDYRANYLEGNLKKAYSPNLNEEAKRAVLAAAAENARELKKYGDRKAEVRFLKDVGKDLTDIQKADMLRAASRSGFSAASIFSVGSGWGLRNLLGRDKTTGQEAIENYVEFLVLQAMSEKLMELRKSLEQLQKQESEKNRAYAADAEKRLAFLVGTSHAIKARKMLLKQGADSEKYINDTLKDQIIASRKLHSGELSSVRLRTA